ncbi:MAG TPA: NADH-quinone oxidoreductase subunit NuoN [Candidatus Cybelea sp.]|nr:NADH-quinone oxidoreductase subunit NuoN [Candidatus Cybelea sp.]
MNLADLNLAAATPEIFLAVAAMVLLMLGVFQGDKATRAVSWLAAIVLVVGAYLSAHIAPEHGANPAFGGQFIVDGFAGFMKVLTLVATAVAILMSLGYASRNEMLRFELPVLMTIAALGMSMMISANNLISLYVGLELQSLALYVTAAFRRDTVKSTEAGLKYFVLGALSSGMLLYGASLIYGFTGSTDFAVLAKALSADSQPGVGLIVGLVFLSAGLAFKISAVPFHMWTPDVYEGAPTPITAFFAVAPKVAAIALFTRVLVGPFLPLLHQWQQIVVVISVLSMLLGGVAAINQRNIKRLMAYSSIGNIGYALVGLAAGTPLGVTGVIIFMTIYIVTTVGAFGVILAMRRKGEMIEEIADLAGLARSQPLLAYSFVIFLFSMAGIPPFAGFFGKVFVFNAAIDAHLYVLAVIGVIASVISCFYYIRIIKVMCFDPGEGHFDRPEPILRAVLVLCSIFVALGVFVPGQLAAAATAAAASLFPG